MTKIEVQKMMEAMRPQLERDESEDRLAGLSVDELAEAVSHPKAAAMIAEIMEAEAASVQEGAPAPEHVCKPPTRDDEHAKHHGIAIDHPLGGIHIGAEVSLYGWDCYGQRGEVVSDYEDSESHCGHAEDGGFAELGVLVHDRKCTPIPKARSLAWRAPYLLASSSLSLTL